MHVKARERSGKDQREEAAAANWFHSLSLSLSCSLFVNSRHVRDEWQARPVYFLFLLEPFFGRYTRAPAGPEEKGGPRALTRRRRCCAIKTTNDGGPLSLSFRFFSLYSTSRTIACRYYYYILLQISQYIQKNFLCCNQINILFYSVYSTWRSSFSLSLSLSCVGCHLAVMIPQETWRWCIVVQCREGGRR